MYADQIKYADHGPKASVCNMAAPLAPLSGRLSGIVATASNAGVLAKAVEGRLFGHRPEPSSYGECDQSECQSVDDLVSRLAGLVASLDATINNIFDRL